MEPQNKPLKYSPGAAGPNECIKSGQSRIMMSHDIVRRRLLAPDAFDSRFCPGLLGYALHGPAFRERSKNAAILSSM